MPEEDRKRVLFIMGLFANTLISFSGFVEVCTQFLLQRHGRKRRRDEYEADGEDENFALAIATMTFEEWPRLWTRVKSIHFVTCVLNGTLMADDEGNGEEFKKQFRLSRASFEVLHNLLRILHFNYMELIHSRTRYTQRGYSLAASSRYPSSGLGLFIISFSRGNLLQRRASAGYLSNVGISSHPRLCLFYLSTYVFHTHSLTHK